MPFVPSTFLKNFFVTVNFAMVSNLQKSCKNIIGNSQVIFTQIHKLPVISPFVLSLSWSLPLSLSLYMRVVF